MFLPLALFVSLDCSCILNILVSKFPIMYEFRLIPCDLEFVGLHTIHYGHLDITRPEVDW